MEKICVANFINFIKAGSSNPLQLSSQQETLSLKELKLRVIPNCICRDPG